MTRYGKRHLVIQSLPFGTPYNTRKKLTLKQVTERPMAYVMQKSYNLKIWYKVSVEVKKENADVLNKSVYVCMFHIFLMH